MQKIFFYAHAGSGNHGCEAIVRSSSKIINKPIELISKNPFQDIQYNLDCELDNILEEDNNELKRYSFPWLISRIQTKLTKKNDLEIYFRKRNIFDQINSNDICFSIGGDNYCYPGTEILAAENNVLKKKGAKTILWGCSVEPIVVNTPSVAFDLAKYDLITARESISYECLKKVNSNTILVSDPAFTLERVDLELPKNWKTNNMVGINVSPLILECALDSSITINAYRSLVKYILDNTDMGIVLVPHVVWANNDDRVPLSILYDEFKYSQRIIMLGDYNCCELKGFIARCRFFVGARTHATIAAYSSCVPTLVLGYSVKSKGIARDLFGSEDHYVIPVQNLQNEQELTEAFVWLMEHENDICNHLKKIMPDYIAKAYVEI